MKLEKTNAQRARMIVVFTLLTLAFAFVPRAARAEEPAKDQSDVLEEDLNKLKDEVFRSKGRTALLEEFLGKTAVEVKFRSSPRRDFDLVSAYMAIDNIELMKKEYEAGTALPDKAPQLIFRGAVTPGRHEITVVLTYRGKKGGGYTDRDYQHLVREDFSFVAARAEMSTVTVTAEDQGYISDDRNRTPSNIKIFLDFKVETQQLAEKRETLERRTIGIQAESGVLFESYQLVSDRLNINRQQTTVIPYGGRVNWWFAKNWGVEAYYLHADYNSPTGLGTSDNKITLNWMGGDLRWRYQFGPSIYYPEVGVKVGYNYLKFGVNPGSQPVTRLSEAYQYVDMAIETKIPITWNFGIKGSLSYLPWIHLDESQANSGFDAKKVGWGAEGGLYYNIWKDLSIFANYKIVLLNNEFTGRGTRTAANGNQLNLVETETVLQGVTAGLRYEF